MLHAGKASSGFMQNVVYSSLGKKTDRLIVGPGVGADNAVIALGGKRVMILTVDPVSVIPPFGIELSAWLSVHLIASDYTTSGLKPEYATFSFNFPPEMPQAAMEGYVRAVGQECERLGVVVAAGHTGSYPGAGFTVIGAGSMFGFADRGAYVETSMAREGDSILMTKFAAIEAAASLALAFPRHAEQKVGNRVASKVRQMIRLCSTVEDAMAAAGVGLGKLGVTSMHDATEGGILGGLYEMASASGRAFAVDEKKINLSDDASAVCAAFGINPLTSLSEGTLLITCASQRVDELSRRLRRHEIPTQEIGKVREGTGLWVSRMGKKAQLARPPKDGYWRAYDRAVSKGLS
ncbi:MAG: AIR synthase-related protein [Thaumarchaeota archaeon]|nr:AIR synthase-related protein [Nitrososphaerota archaeon]